MDWEAGFRGSVALERAAIWCLKVLSAYHGHESRKRCLLFSHCHLLIARPGFTIIPLCNYQEGFWVSHDVANY